MTKFSNRFSSTLPVILLIGLSVFIIYSNIYNSPFVFDDEPRIVENRSIKNLSYYLNPSKLLEPRAVVDLTFALNYRFGKLNVFGYHLVNVWIHILNGILVYFLVSGILKQRAEFLTPTNHLSSESATISIKLIAILSAMIFVVHPVQTQAVTYTVQRYTSMAAMFYMGSMLSYLYARTVQPRTAGKAIHRFNIFGLYTLTIVFGMLAFLSKENSASLPGSILLLEYLIINGRWPDWKKKLPWFALAFTLWLFFVLFVSGLFSGEVGDRNLLEDVSALTKETAAVSRWSYLCTQFNVLVIYIRLLFLPINQNLDYFYPFKTGFFEGATPFAFIILIGIAGFGIWSKNRRPVITFSIFYFFITLSIESSIIPIRDALFEHRLYLPMLGFGLFISYQLFYYLSTKRTLAFIFSFAIIAFLGSAAYLRNITWQDNVILWSDVVSKSPHNYRAHNNLGLALDKQGRTDEAIDQYMQGLQIKPDNEEIHNNLGLALAEQGRTDEAISHYLEALHLRPDFGQAHNNLGVVLMEKGRTEEAVSHYKEALRINPDTFKAHYNLGDALIVQKGVTPEALHHYNEALRLEPESVEAHNSLGIALIRMGKVAEGIDILQEALRIEADSVDTHANLGAALLKLGKTDQAVVYLRKALQIKPDIPEVHTNLGIILADKGKYAEAVAHFRKALKADPDNADAQRNLEKTLAFLREIDGNIEKIENALRLRPEDPLLNSNLGDMFRIKGDLDTAMEYYQKAILLQPDLTEALYHLAKLYIIKAEYDRAMSLYQKMLDLLPDHAGVYYNIACIYAKQNRPEEAVAWLEKSIEKGFDDWEHLKADGDLDNIRGSSTYKDFIRSRGR